MTTKKELKLRTLTIDILKDCGCPMSNIGFEYVVDAALIVYNAKGKRLGLTDDVYKAVAAKHNTKWTAVERGIRTVIARMIDTGDLDYIQDVFGAIMNRNNGSITSGDFIYGVKYEMEKRLLNEEDSNA